MSKPIPSAFLQDLPIIYHQDYSTYQFGLNHPANPHKRELLVRLFDALGYPLAFIEPEPASDSDLLSVHTEAYLHCVASASTLSWAPGSLRFGLDTDDVPIFPNMDDAARLQVGGTLLAARMVAEGKTERVLQLGGGFHHAMPARAAGFCIYNDLSVAIQYLRSQHLRVAYIDIDVHHGDGVQWVHYRDPDVFTFSIHESGRYLFPNTGSIDEKGEGDGKGSVINIPLEKHTDNESFLEAIETILPLALEQFQPDILIIPCGVDAHFLDPLAHLNLTTQGFERLFQLLLSYTDQYSNGRAIFTLGGGYDAMASIRNWTILIHILQNRPLPEALPENWLASLPGKPAPPVTLHDQVDPVPEIVDRERMMHINRETVAKVMQFLKE